MLKTQNAFIAGVLIAVWLAPALASANSPTEQIQQTIQQVATVVANRTNGYDRRKELLREALMPHFDWLEMSKQALGKHWSHATGRENEFVSAFAEFLGNAYIGQIGSYRNEKIQQTIQQVATVVANRTNGYDRRKELLREALMPHFDWLEMSKQALGKHWSHATGRENEFVSAFAEFLGNAYIGQIGSYRNEKI